MWPEQNSNLTLATIGLRSTNLRLLHPVIGRFARDHYIVHVALAQACAANAHEFGFLLQFRNARAAYVTHTTLHAADKLVHDHSYCAAIWDPPFNAFRNKFRQAISVATLLCQYRNRRIVGRVSVRALEV